MKQNSKRIVLAGGGLVGSLLGVMLGQRGHDVTIFEKRGDMRCETMSAGRSINLALAERGMNALRIAGLMDEVQPLLIPMRGRMLHPLGEQQIFSPYGQREHEVIYSVSRGELNKTMLSAAESSDDLRIFFQHQCTAVDPVKKEVTVTNLLNDTTMQVPYDILIGTDGAASVVRESIAKQTGSQWRTEWLDHDYKELEIPPGPGGSWQIEREALHIWPRHGFMLIALPNLGGSFTLTLFLQKTGDPGFQQLVDGVSVVRFFQEQFPNAMKLIPDLQADFFGNPTGQLGTVRCERWTNGSDTLIIGDAAHAIVPFHGQGMNAGFEDCALLTGLLDKHAGGWSSAMREFESTHLSDGNAIADMALENYVTMRDSVLDEEFQLKKTIGFELERRFPDRFIPRYSMVMFHRIPYATVQQRGRIQDRILGQLIARSGKSAEFDGQLAEELILSQLPPVNASLA